MNFKIIKSPQKRKLERSLGKKLPNLIIKDNRGNTYGFSGNMPKEEIIEISRLTKVESIGLKID